MVLPAQLVYPPLYPRTRASDAEYQSKCPMRSSCCFAMIRKREPKGMRLSLLIQRFMTKNGSIPSNPGNRWKCGISLVFGMSSSFANYIGELVNFEAGGIAAEASTPGREGMTQAGSKR